MILRHGAPLAGAAGRVDDPARSCDIEPKGLLLVHLETPSALVTAPSTRNVNKIKVGHLGMQPLWPGSEKHGCGAPAMT